ncbi:LuxR family transcriptional regulator [Streptomyces sp. SAJ15]|uniref:helix-turn-helix transcriptional regulator n=1 Tax=Streptomyces sp. SAJ15 TaxID=2011095 RepID=UPI0011848C7A|nr:LuxR family transcriptional regulator [Streptomyces sp. SAJ15]TVL88953.1 LuxR family transcriptional regulator [Streptomyces sp. SAJ15]
MDEAYDGREAFGAYGSHETDGSLEAQGSHDELERSLLEVCALIEQTVDKHRDRRAQPALVYEVPAGSADHAALARELIAGATESVEAVLAGEPGRRWATHGTLHELTVAGLVEAATRVLCTRATFDPELLRRLPAWKGRPAVRVSGMPTLEVLIVDERAALVCVDSGSGGAASLIHAPSVIRGLHTLFERVWRTAMEPTGPVGLNDGARTRLNRRILEQLRAGVTDEVAARELAVSVRTYRRYVAELMSRLGATSRFQAGVLAAEYGLLPAPTAFPAPTSAPASGPVPVDRRPSAGS